VPGSPTVDRFGGWDELSERHAAVLGDAARETFFRSVPWFKALGASSLDEGDAVRLYAAGDPPSLILPLRQPARRGALRARRLTSLANFYSCDFAPLARAGAPRARDVAAIAGVLRAEAPAVDLIELTSLPFPSDAFDALARGFAEAGWWLQPYFHFANWYEPTAGRSADAYLAARPPSLRNTVERKTRALAKRSDAQVALIVGDPALPADELEPAIAAYEQVYGASWKVAEPYPCFAASFIRAAAETGGLRLGLVTIAGVPAAAQIWIVWQGRATLCKLAHDERYKGLSVGSVLTWRMIQHVLDVDRVREVDFGRGDDPFKQLWMTQRREHWGLLVFNPATPRGLLAAARHLGGRRVARVLQRWRQRAPANARAGAASEIATGASCTRRRNASNMVSDHSARL
jgi:Acetyltransferase (GNAT) domain